MWHFNVCRRKLIEMIRFSFAVVLSEAAAVRVIYLNSVGLNWVVGGERDKASQNEKRQFN